MLVLIPILLGVEVLKIMGPHVPDFKLSVFFSNRKKIENGVTWDFDRARQITHVFGDTSNLIAKSYGILWLGISPEK